MSLKDIMSTKKVSAISTTDLLACTHNKAGLPNPVSAREMSIILSMLILLCFVVFHKFILGSAVYLFKDIGSDTLNLYYPLYINVSETLREAGIPGWSFEQGLGQNSFPFSLSNPTAYLLYLLGSDSLSFGIVWVEILKIIGSGLLFFCFLKKLNLEDNAAYMGGLLYAFSGFMIVGGGWYVFSTLGLYTALILLAFEMLYSEGKWWLFPISVALIAAYNFVSLYTCSVFLLFYVLFRVFSGEEISLTKLPALLLRLLSLGALGVLISAVFSIPNLLQMIDSPRVSGNASHVAELVSTPVFEPGNSDYLVTLLMRTFSSDLLGNGSAYKGWMNYLETPMSYCGLASLLLLPQLFAFLKARQKFVYGIFIGLFIFAEIFPWFRRGFWLFQGDYFRDFSLYVSTIFILFAALALSHVSKSRKVNHWVLGASFFALLLLLYLP
ncbi:MAG TPA: YfhO family protein, partial [Gallionella sp.]|nr:YfhO family protein [Gallionella sp.]